MSINSRQMTLRLTFLFLFLWGLTLQNYAHTSSDSINAFEDQRQRVNQLLNERSRKFGEYDESLKQKTGIFGLFKSKGDMQRSIDILKEIVINDNNIFIETRKLLDLKDSERERYQRMATEYDQQVTAYMKTISKLQQENERLKEKINTLEQEEHQSSSYLSLFIFVTLVLIGIIIYLYTRLRAKNVTKV